MTCKACQEELNEFCLVCRNLNKLDEQLEALVRDQGYETILNALIERHPDPHTKMALIDALKIEPPTVLSPIEIQAVEMEILKQLLNKYKLKPNGS